MARCLLLPTPPFTRACCGCPTARPGGARTAVPFCCVPAWLLPPLRFLRGRRGVRYGGRRGPSGGGGGGGGGGGKEDGGRGTRVDPRDSLQHRHLRCRGQLHPLPPRHPLLAREHPVRCLLQGMDWGPARRSPAATHGAAPPSTSANPPRLTPYPSQQDCLPR